MLQQLAAFIPVVVKNNYTADSFQFRNKIHFSGENDEIFEKNISWKLT